MQYTLLLYSNPADYAHMGPEDFAEMRAAFGQYIGMLKEAGVMDTVGWLEQADTATTLTLKGGTRQVQDGPFAETRETLGGFFVISVPDLDAAMDWAAKCPVAQMGKVEIRANNMPVA